MNCITTLLKSKTKQNDLHFNGIQYCDSIICILALLDAASLPRLPCLSCLTARKVIWPMENTGNFRVTIGIIINSSQWVMLSL